MPEGTDLLAKQLLDRRTYISHFIIMKLVHGTSISINGVALLLTGDPGAGKSDLALRLIDRGALLIADDYTELRPDDDGRLLARAPTAIAGKMEVRGIGIVAKVFCDDIPLKAIIQLVPRDQVPRLPDVETQIFEGVSLPCYRLCAHDISAVIKAEIIARSAASGVRAGIEGVESDAS